MTTKSFAEQQTIELPVTINLSLERPQNLLVGLFENGYSNWFRGLKEKIYSEKYPEEYFEQFEYPFYEIPFHEGCYLVLEVDDPDDCDNPEVSKLVKVGLEEIKAALKLMAEKFSKHFNDLVEENDDANTADIFGQLLAYQDDVFC